MTPAIQDAYRKLRAELATNKRLAWGLLLIAGILAVQLFLVLLGVREAQADAYAQKVQQLEKMQALSGQDIWISRAQAAARLRKALEAEIPGAETPGVAQAQAVTWARDALTAINAESPQIQPGQPEQVDGMAGIWRIPIVVSGAASPDRVVQLIRQIERKPTLATVEEAMILNKENKTFSLTVVSFAKVPVGGTNAGG